MPSYKYLIFVLNSLLYSLLLGLPSDVKRPKNADRFSYVVKLIPFYLISKKFDRLQEIFRYESYLRQNGCSNQKDTICILQPE